MCGGTFQWVTEEHVGSERSGWDVVEVPHRCPDCGDGTVPGPPLAYLAADLVDVGVWTPEQLVNTGRAWLEVYDWDDTEKPVFAIRPHQGMNE